MELCYEACMLCECVLLRLQPAPVNRCEHDDMLCSTCVSPFLQGWVHPVTK